MQEKVTVFADHRETQSECFQLLSQNPRVDLKIKTLMVGDYEIGAFIFERKTLPDLAQSIIDGRLFKQMRCLISKKNPVLLIEGAPQDMGKHGVSRSSLQGALIHITLLHNIPILYALTAKEAGLLMVYTAQQHDLLRKEYVSRFGYAPKTKTKRQLYILQGLPQIGKKRAQLLLQHFGTVRAVMNAPLEALQQVKGIGGKRALEIYEILNHSVQVKS